MQQTLSPALVNPLPLPIVVVTGHGEHSMSDAQMPFSAKHHEMCLHEAASRYSFIKTISWLAQRKAC